MQTFSKFVFALGAVEAIRLRTDTPVEDEAVTVTTSTISPTSKKNPKVFLNLSSETFGIDMSSPKTVGGTSSAEEQDEDVRSEHGRVENASDVRVVEEEDGSNISVISIKSTHSARHSSDSVRSVHSTKSGGMEAEETDESGEKKAGFTCFGLCAPATPAHKEETDESVEGDHDAIVVDNGSDSNAGNDGSDNVVEVTITKREGSDAVEKELSAVASDLEDMEGEMGAVHGDVKKVDCKVEALEQTVAEKGEKIAGDVAELKQMVRTLSNASLHGSDKEESDVDVTDTTGGTSVIDASRIQDSLTMEQAKSLLAKAKKGDVESDGEEEE